jgi:hypothetical protein
LRLRLGATVAILACLGAAAFASSAQAVLLVATNGTGLTSLDSSSTGVTSSVPISGLQAGETLVGMDFRPSDGQLYGIGSASRIYRLNPASGVAVQVGTAGAFALNGTAFGMDFNPVADRIRSVSNAEQNLRLSPIDGTLSGTDSALNPAGNVVAAAYSNNFAGATATTLYDIDSASGMLVIQNPPNNGTLATVGSLGLGTNLNENIGLDIAGVDGVAYATITTGGTSKLYTVNLATGASTLVGTIGTGATPYLGVTAATSAVVGFDSPSASATEGGNATLTVSRAGPTSGAVTVDYSTASGTAGSGQDFGPTSGTLSWAAGDSTPKAITVPITDDAASEGAETFNVTLSNPTGGAMVRSPATATVTIEASDQQPQQAPGPGPDVKKPLVTTSIKKTQRLSTVFKRGAAFKATTSESCVLTADMLLSKRTAKRLKLSRRIARKRTTLAAGTRSLRLKPTRKAARKLRRLRKVGATLTASCVDPAGNRGAAKSHSLTLKR